MTIKRQLILFFAPLIAIIAIMLTVYTQYEAYKSAIIAANTTSISIAADQSSDIQVTITSASGFAEVFAAMMSDTLSDGATTRKDVIALLKVGANSDKRLFGIGVILPDFDTTHNEEYKDTELGNDIGICAPYLFSPDGKKMEFQELTKESYTGTEYLSTYKTGKKLITTPYIDDTLGTTPVLMVTIAEPIKVRDKVIGLLIVDISLEGLSDMVRNIQMPYHGGVAFVATNDGTVVAHPNLEERLRNIKDFNAVDKKLIEKDLASNLTVQENGTDKDGTDVITILYPFTVMDGTPPWYFGLFLPESEVMSDFTSSLYKTLAISIIGMIVAVGLTIYVAGNIARSVQRITNFSAEIAKGNYDASVTTKGFTKELVSLKNSLTDMVSSLLETMKEANQSKQAAEEGLRKAEVAMAEAEESKAKAEESQKSMLVAAENIENVSTRLSTAAEQLSAQVEESSRSADQQREQVGVSVNAMEQMNSTVLDVAQNASKASEGSENTKRSAEEGANIVRESISSIKEVEDNVNVLQEEMEGLGKQAESIGTIMTVISDIADQTNLLALNAAIEAARAGEAGRGFAVVADEVRKLAEKTMDATGEVGKAVNGIQQGMIRSVSALGVTATNISKSTGLVAKSGDALAEIVDEAIISAEQISSIAAAVEEQSASCQNINDSLLDINRISDEVATVMQESSQAVMDLSKQATELEELVGSLRGSK